MRKLTQENNCRTPRHAFLREQFTIAISTGEAVGVAEETIAEKRK